MVISNDPEQSSGIKSQSVSWIRFLLAFFSLICLFEKSRFERATQEMALPAAMSAHLAYISLAWLPPALILHWAISREIWSSGGGYANGWVGGTPVTIFIPGPGSLQRGSPALGIFFMRYWLTIVPLVYFGWDAVSKFAFTERFGGVPFDAVIAIAILLFFFVGPGIFLYFVFKSRALPARIVQYGFMAAFVTGMLNLICWNLYFLATWLTTRPN